MRACVCNIELRVEGRGDRGLAGWRLAWGAQWPGRGGPTVRTRVGRAVGQRQVGAGPPGPRAEVLAALAAVGARGVVLALALQAALAHGAQVGVQVTLAPAGTQDRVSELGGGCGAQGGVGAAPSRPQGLRLRVDLRPWIQGFLCLGRGGVTVPRPRCCVASSPASDPFALDEGGHQGARRSP